nr:reverse transcriptase domain-containing protein [Tanacetum cinerariifolium]
MVDNRTMEEILQAPTEGYGDAIEAKNLIKVCLFGLGTVPVEWSAHEKSVGVMSILAGNAVGGWLGWVRGNNEEIRIIEKVVPMADRTMEELLQAPTEGFEETFGEAWERFKEMLRACPHHGFSELTKIDTFYNGLNEQDQDSLNAATGGNLLSKTTREALKLIENKSKVRYSRFKSNVSRVNTNSRESSSKTDYRIDKLADQISNLVEIVNKQVITPAMVKEVEKSYVICGGAHAYYDCIATDSIQSSICAATVCKTRISALGDKPYSFFAPEGKPPRRGLNPTPLACCNNLPKAVFFQNQAPTSGTPPINTIPNPKGEMKAVITRIGLAYEGPSIPTNYSPEKVVKRETEETTDKEQHNYQGSTAHVQPSVVPTPIPKLDVPKTQPKPNIPYPSRFNDQKLCEKLRINWRSVFQIFHDLHFDISFADALLLMPKFASTIKSLLTNKDKSQQAATRNRGKAIVNSPQPIYDQEPFMVAEDDEMSKDKEIDKLMALISLSSQQAATRDRGKAIVNSLQPIYDQEPFVVAEDDETSKDKEINKLMALMSLSFKKIYKPTNNNLRTSSNTSRANQDNSLRINRSAGYENQRIGNVSRARETVGSTMV